MYKYTHLVVPAHFFLFVVSCTRCIASYAYTIHTCSDLSAVNWSGITHFISFELECILFQNEAKINVGSTTSNFILTNHPICKYT